MRSPYRQGLRLVAPVLTLGALAVLFLGLGSGTPRAQVPGVLGKDKARAVERIEHRNLRAVISRDRATRRLPSRFRGKIVHQSFRRGITLPEGSVVRLTIYPRGKGLPTRSRVNAARSTEQPTG